jgi:hypothetical protein
VAAVLGLVADLAFERVGYPRHSVVATPCGLG